MKRGEGFACGFKRRWLGHIWERRNRTAFVHTSIYPTFCRIENRMFASKHRANGSSLIDPCQNYNNYYIHIRSKLNEA